MHEKNHYKFAGKSEQRSFASCFLQQMFLMQLGKNTLKYNTETKNCDSRDWKKLFVYGREGTEIKSKRNRRKTERENLLEFSVLNKFDIFQTKNSAQFDYTSILG